MNEIFCDVAVIGAGPAGLAASVAAKKQGAGKVLVIERDTAPGGILRQCIHPGFGLSYFNEELTGPEYAGRFIASARQEGVEFLPDTIVLEISGSDVICSGSKNGISTIRAKSIVLAMGCRERTRGNLAIPGTRPSGIYTAGAAQRLINIQNIMVGRRILILGSGDIGMIMARRLSLEGAEVVAVVEIMDYLAGLTRNRVQCLDDYNIPLMLSHTVTRIEGEKRLTGCMVAKVDENRRPVPGTEKLFECDTLLLSVGLIPENELSLAAGIRLSSITGGPVVNQFMQTSIPNIFACGNVVHVNDLADNVSAESETAGRESARFAAGTLPEHTGSADCVPGKNIRYICPQTVAINDCESEIKLYFRVARPHVGALLTASSNGRVIASKKTVKVNPGEMEHLAINTATLTPGEIVIDAQENKPQINAE